MPLDAEAIGRGCTAKLTQANQLCGLDLDRFKEALAEGSPITVACTQEAPLFREVADVDEGELGLRRTLRDLPKQRRFLRTSDCDRRSAGERLLEAIEFETAKLVRLRDVSRAAARNRCRIERHGLLAAAYQEARRRRTHYKYPEPRAPNGRLLRPTVLR